jgi:hypothetical protein
MFIANDAARVMSHRRDWEMQPLPRSTGAETTAPYFDLLQQIPSSVTTQTL